MDIYDDKPEELLSTRDAAKLLGVKPSWIYRLAKKKGLPAVRIGKHLRYPRRELTKWAINQKAWEWRDDPIDWREDAT